MSKADPILATRPNVPVYREFSSDLNKPIASDLDSRLMALCDKFLALFEAYHVPIYLQLAL
ncbi:MAG: hypothetical protein EWV80_17310 [Microcystis aeruginosa Ma_QC_B_20070730_S2]|uniref:Uncharacterized protein n=1 Tax=Microcystis aeruginosa Ma_QC_B_20070730_S2 TaxID=2486256 RepID=A0A552DEX4_MICAE|nr:MAG: hypothetical protein EWV80_17310 [Microcystis aeruginosa Ma_QC_B_20070730_S2]